MNTRHTTPPSAASTAITATAMMPRPAPPPPFGAEASTLAEDDGLGDAEDDAAGRGDDAVGVGLAFVGVADGLTEGERVGGGLITISPHIPPLQVPSAFGGLPWKGQ
jgi:hypothetical protein